MKPSAKSSPPIVLRPAHRLTATEREQWVREHAGQRWDATEYVPRPSALERWTEGQGRR